MSWCWQPAHRKRPACSNRLTPTPFRASRRARQHAGCPAARPLSEKHGIIDVREGAYIADVANIQPKLNLDGAFSAVMVERSNESAEERNVRFDEFLDRTAKGWQHHVVHQRKQASITVQTTGTKPAYDRYIEHGILLAGEWVDCEHELADAAAATESCAGKTFLERLFTAAVHRSSCVLFHGM